MKHKKLWIVLGIILLILIVAAVAVRVFLLEPFEVSELEGVHLTVVEDSVTREGLRCVVANETDEMIEFAPSHSWFLDKKDVFGWGLVVTQVSSVRRIVPADIQVVWAGESYEMEWDWTRCYGKLSPGTYRLRVEFEHSKWLAAEFVIP